mmetsp:Transcript_1700/g.5985  ORF Transcript_1700/g.5985 Transcript_1700/m.5985 type:complete len:81 (-) Transcript_1700:1799-2041(-)
MSHLEDSPDAQPCAWRCLIVGISVVLGFYVFHVFRGVMKLYSLRRHGRAKSPFPSLPDDAEGPNNDGKNHNAHEDYCGNS